MGAMAPQHSLDEQVLMLSGDPKNLDLPPPANGSEGTKKEHLTFKLSSPNTFRPFLMSIDQKHKLGLWAEDEVEDLYQPSPPLQQGWNLGLLKTNSLCKDYYKLTSNMLHTLVVGIKELTNGEISPIWQVAKDRGCQKQSSLSNTFVQDVAIKSITPTNSSRSTHVCHGSKPTIEQSLDMENTFGIPLKPTLKNNGGQKPSAKEIEEKVQDLDGILELRKLLWRQIAPNSCPRVTLDNKHDEEKTIRLVQESRMKVVNNVGLGVNSASNCSFHETSQVSLTVGQQQKAFKESNVEVSLSPSTPSMDIEQSRVTFFEISRTSDNLKTRSIHEVEEVQGSSTSYKEGEEHETTKTKYSVSFPKEDVDMPLEEEFGCSRDVNDTQPLKRSKLSVNEETIYQHARSRTSKFHAKETRFSIDGHILPIYDEEFEIVEEPKENPSRYPNRTCLGYSGGEDSPNESYLGNRHFRQWDLTQCKEAAKPKKPATRSWCIVGSFNSKSPTTPRNLTHSQKT